jgi:hypothetical protein
MVVLALIGLIVALFCACFAYAVVSTESTHLSEVSSSYWDEIQEHIDEMKGKLDVYTFEHNRSTQRVYDYADINLPARSRE